MLGGFGRYYRASSGTTGRRPVLPGAVRYYRATRKKPQRLVFGRGYKYPSPSSTCVSMFSSLSPTIVDLGKLAYFPIPPPKLVDSWRIEGEDLDLHFHKSISPLSEENLVDLVLGVLLWFSSLFFLSYSPISICCFVGI